MNQEELAKQPVITEEWVERQNITDPERILIRMTHQEPITIIPTEWPIIAQVEEAYDAVTRILIRVRKKGDETLVYGLRQSLVEPTRYAGILHNPEQHRDSVPRAILHGLDRTVLPFEMRQRLVQKLPATPK